MQTRQAFLDVKKFCLALSHLAAPTAISEGRGFDSSMTNNANFMSIIEFIGKIYLFR